MALLPALLATGIVGSAAVGAVAYLDDARRDGSGRLRRALAPAVACLGGFLVPYAVSEQLRWLYFEVLKPQPIAASPREWLAVNLVAGASFAGAFVALVFARRRATTPTGG